MTRAEVADPTSPLSASDAAAIRERLPAVDDAKGLEAVHGLTPAQESMLFHALADAGPDLYVVQQRLQIDGPLDVDRFDRAWQLVVDHHPALRSSFAWQGAGPPMQLVHRTVAVPVSFEDLTVHDDVEAVLYDRFRSDRSRPFDLARPPLMRLTVFRVAADRHVVCWSQHHVLEDGWSASVVLGDVFAAYDDLTDGAPADLADAPTPADYVTWLDEHVDTAADETFWASHLDGFDRPTRIAGPAGAGDTGVVHRLLRTLDQETSAGVRALARRARVTLNAVMLGGLAVALARHQGHDDVATAIVASGRSPAFAGVERLVGMCINTLPLRLQVDESLPAVEWVRLVQERQADALDHQHTALGDLQSRFGPAGGAPLSDVLFAFWAFGGEGSNRDGSLRYRTTEGAGRTSFPVSITVEGTDPLRIALDVDPSRVDEAAAAGLLDLYTGLLAAMVAAPDEPLTKSVVLDDAHRRFLAEFNRTEATPAFSTMPRAIAASIRETPDAVAVEVGDDRLTYREFGQRVSTLADRIRAVSADDPSTVAVHLPRSLDLVVALVATWWAGAAAIPLDRHLPASRIRLVVDDAAPGVVVTAEALRSNLRDLDVPVLTVDHEPTERPSDEAPDDPAPDAPAYVMYTSGSTGLPKGVVVSHGSIANYVAWAADAYAGQRPVSMPLHTSPGFDLTLTSVYLPLVTGGSVVVYPDDDPRDLSVLEVFADDRVDVVKLTPSHLALLGPDDLATERIDTLVLGGEDLRTGVARAVVEANPGLTIFNEYGPTEATVGCMVHRFDPEADTAASVPLGRPIANARVHLLDARGRPVPVGVPGELSVAGAGVASGYLGRPDLTAERFVPDPERPTGRMYRTGDRARWSRPGVLEFLGRVDDQVKVRGARIEPAEIEAALAEHPSVAAAAVAVRSVGPGDDRLVGYYVPAPGAVVNLTELRAHLRSRLPEHMVTGHLVRLDELPLTANGKVDRDALPSQIGEVERAATGAPPRTEAESLVVEAAADLLGGRRPGVDDNFFDLGGHSILAMRLVARLHAETGVRVSPRVVLLDTLGAVAARLGDVGSHTVAPAVATTRHRGTGTTAFHFGPGDRPLFGILDAPPPDVEPRGGVVVCPPYGWEYLRTHWALRRIARRLAAAGFHALRFDYLGTGDSAGDVANDSLERWVTDVASAAGELDDVTHGEPVSVIGARLGATLAVLAAADGLVVDRLVLWDPVLSGADHLADLERMHGELLAGRRRRDRDRRADDELLGHPYPRGLRERLRRIDLRDAVWPDVPVTIVASGRRDDDVAVARRVATVDHRVVPDAAGWADLAAVHARLLPTRLSDHVIETLAGGAA